MKNCFGRKNTMQARFNPSRHKDAVSVRVLTIPISARKDYNLFQRYFNLAYNIKNQAPFVEHFFTKKIAFSFIECPPSPVSKYVNKCKPTRFHEVNLSHSLNGHTFTGSRRVLMVLHNTFSTK